MRVQTILTGLCGLFLVLSFLPIHPALAYISVLFGSYFALKSAWESVAERTLDVNFLMVFAAIGAIVVGHAQDAAALLFLFSLSSTLEALALARTRSAIEGLIKLRPAEAIRLTASGDEKVAVESLKLGDHIRLLPFNQIPTDGVVLQGSSSLDQSAMTGESQPVSVTAGAKAIGGTQNLEGMLVLEVSAIVGNSTLDKIVSLVQDAQENKASGERISQWFGQRYTVFVFVAFTLSVIIRYSLQQEAAFYQSLILLVALSPCAVVISTPASTLSALAWSARNGILVRGGEFIELIGKVNTAVMDKTGTLTLGKPELVEICVCHKDCVADEACWTGHGEMSPQALEMLRLAAIGEQYSTHPIAEGIVKAAKARNLEIPEAEDQQSVAGLGVIAKIGDKTVKIGQRRFFEQDGNQLDADFAGHAEKLQQKGMTVAIMECDGVFAALGMRDEPKPAAQKTIDELHQLGVDRILMLTGDTKETAKAVAEELGLKEFQGGLLPEDKTRIIEQLESEGRKTMMVGDGINDAPSLARATVGIAMGGLGSDVALNAADIVLMQDKLEKIPALVKLGRRTNSVIKTNLYFATGMIVALTICSLFFKLPLPLAVIGHEGSTVLVILNGLRLLKGP